MTSLEKIEKAITALSPEDLRKLATWFAEFHGDLWDQQIEDDVKAGRLDKLADEALAHHRSGRTSPL